MSLFWLNFNTPLSHLTLFWFFTSLFLLLTLYFWSCYWLLIPKVKSSCIRPPPFLALIFEHQKGVLYTGFYGKYQLWNRGLSATQTTFLVDLTLLNCPWVKDSLHCAEQSWAILWFRLFFLVHNEEMQGVITEADAAHQHCLLCENWTDKRRLWKELSWCMETQVWADVRGCIQPL